MQTDGAKPVRKKQKIINHLAMESTMAFSRLTKHRVEYDAALSPGSVHSNRIAVQACEDTFYTYCASGRRVHVASVPPVNDLAGEVGKGGAFIPNTATPASSAILDELTNRSEIQSLHLSSTQPDGTAILATADCYGRATLARLRISFHSEHTEDGAPSNSNISSSSLVRILGVEQLQPATVAVEAGWAGVTVAPDQPSQTAIARHFAKDITLFDGTLPVRTIHTMYRPYSVTLLSSTVATGPGNSPVVAASEGPMVSVWDVRGAGRGARVARFCPKPHAGHLYCVAVTDGSGPPLLGAAGADRSVLVYDPRMWRLIDRWNNCLKYEATSVHFLTANSAYCVACGVDYEVVAGQWGGERRNRLGGGQRTAGVQVEDGPDGDLDDTLVNANTLSFRGDSRWMGFSKANGRDVFAGLTATKQLYVAEIS